MLRGKLCNTELIEFGTVFKAAGLPFQSLEVDLVLKAEWAGGGASLC